eukprot:13317683-Heterocapsa_arctica.AAC.1
MDENNTIGGWMRFTYDEGAARTPLDSPGKHTDVNPNATYRTEIIEDAGGPPGRSTGSQSESTVQS